MNKKLFVLLAFIGIIQTIVLWTVLNLSEQMIGDSGMNFQDTGLQLQQQPHERQKEMISMISSLRSRSHRRERRRFNGSSPDAASIMAFIPKQSTDCAPLLNFPSTTNNVFGFTFARVSLRTPTPSDEDLPVDRPGSPYVPLLVVATPRSSTVYRLGFFEQPKQDLKNRFSLLEPATSDAERFSMTPIQEIESDSETPGKFLQWNIGTANFLLSIHPTPGGASTLFMFDQKSQKYTERQKLFSGGESVAHVSFFELGHERFLCAALPSENFIGIFVLAEKGLFIEIQKITVEKASSCAMSSPEENKFYLLVSGGACRLSSVDVFLWDRSTRLFSLSQKIPSAGTTHISTFKIQISRPAGDGDDIGRVQHFAFLSNKCNGGSTRLQSQLLLYRSSRFTEFQRFYTDGAVSSTHFESSNGKHFLAVASVRQEGPSFSTVYIFLESVGRFELTQVLKINSPKNFEYFSINGTDFLAASADSPAKILSCFKGGSEKNEFSAAEIVAEKNLKINFDPPGGSYQESVLVSLEIDGENNFGGGVEIWYVLDFGQDPTAPLRRYEGPFLVSAIGAVSVNAFLVADENIHSAVFSSRFSVAVRSPISRGFVELKQEYSLPGPAKQKWWALNFPATEITPPPKFGLYFASLSRRLPLAKDENVPKFQTLTILNAQLIADGKALKTKPVQNIEVSAADLATFGKNLILVAGIEDSHLALFRWEFSTENFLRVSSTEMSKINFVILNNLGSGEKSTEILSAVISDEWSVLTVVAISENLSVSLLQTFTLKSNMKYTAVTFSTLGGAHVIAVSTKEVSISTKEVSFKTLFYLWDRAASKFVERASYQKIPDIFVEHILAIQPPQNEPQENSPRLFFLTSPSGKSCLVQLDAKTGVKEISTVFLPGAVSSSHFRLGNSGVDYLAVSIHHKDSPSISTPLYSTNSYILAIKNSGLETVAEIPTLGARDILPFTSLGQMCFAVAQEQDEARGPSVDSWIYCEKTK